MKELFAIIFRAIHVLNVKQASWRLMPKNLNGICNYICNTGKEWSCAHVLIPWIHDPCFTPSIPFCHPSAAYMSYPVDLLASLFMLLCLGVWVLLAGLAVPNGIWAGLPKSSQSPSNLLHWYSTLLWSHFANSKKRFLFYVYTTCHALVVRRFSKLLSVHEWSCTLDWGFLSLQRGCTTACCLAATFPFASYIYTPQWVTDDRQTFNICIDSNKDASQTSQRGVELASLLERCV